jgi:energy-coupling factor transporter ATP-binding protein EcfA2
MFEKLEVTNFKAVGSPGVELQLAPLTLLVGDNGAGKSSLLEALALLAQSARPLRMVGLVTDGRLVKLGSDTAALYHRGKSSADLRVSVDLRLDGREHPVTCWFSVSDATAIAVGSWNQGLADGPRGGIRILKKPSAGGGFYLEAIMEGESGSQTVAVAGEPARFLDEQMLIPLGDVEPAVRQRLAAWRSIANRAAEFLSGPSVRFVSALRGGPLMTYDAESAAPEAAGRYGEDTVRLLSRLESQGTREQKDRLRTLASRFGMHDFTAGWGGAKTLVATFEDAVTRTRQPMAHAGSGSQQALPIIADVVSAGRGSSVLIEELEHSCHPAWVRQWATVLAEIVRDSQIQVIATTHAPDLVLGVMAAVRRGVLRPDQVAIHEIRRDQNGVRAERYVVEQTGVLAGGWIRGFADSESRLFDEVLGEDDEKGPEPTGAP